MLLAAAEEERFVRIKHVAGFPAQAIQYCLRSAGASLQDLDAVALSRNPASHWAAKASQALRKGVFSPAVGERLKILSKIRNLKRTLTECLGADEDRLRASVHFVEHHRAHMASSYYPSGWNEAAVISLDGFGDFLSGMWGIGRGNRLSVSGEVFFPHSLGILYTAMTQFLGFHQWGDEYKVMGLAPYGKPERFRDAVAKLAQSVERGDYRLGLEFFRHSTEHVAMAWETGAPVLETLFSPRLEELLGPARVPGSPLEERHADIAASLQERLEEIVFGSMRYLASRARMPRLCYAGGVALNCSLNGKLRRNTPFKEIFIQPAAHDAGTSLGAALYVAHHRYSLPRRFVMTHAGWGPESPAADCRRALENAHLSYREMLSPELIRTASIALAEEKIIGWFQGRMEFGPRALGHRSLLADPRDPGMKDRINRRVKRREAFRPFAPSILTEAVPAFFPQGHPDPFMLFAYPVHIELEKTIPAVVHVDGTGRLQAVSREAEPLYWQLLKSFDERTDVPVLLNTSFNEQEPLVCRPEEAVACFKRNEIDCLALGPFWVERTEALG